MRINIFTTQDMYLICFEYIFFRKTKLHSKSVKHISYIVKTFILIHTPLQFVNVLKKQIIGNMRYLIVFVNICFKTSTIQMKLQIGIYCLIIDIIINVISLNKQTSLNEVIFFVTVFIL